jgi:hypothetical protein
VADALKPLLFGASGRERLLGIGPIRDMDLRLLVDTEDPRVLLELEIEARDGRCRRFDVVVCTGRVAR